MATDPVVHSILFRPDDRVEISYQEERDQSDFVNVIRTIVLEKEPFSELTADLEAAAIELVDEGVRRLLKGQD